VTSKNDDGALGAKLAERLAGLLRGFGWRWATVVRRWLAGLLALAAILLAVRGQGPDPNTAAVLVAARDLAPGSTLTRADVQLRRWPPGLAPAGVLTAVEQADGQVLASAANAGEALTAARLAGPGLASRALGGTDAASVPVRLADAGVAGLLSPGRQVDVVTLGDHSDQPTVLAAGATVLAVLPAEQKPSARGRLVLVAVPRAAAPRLAAAALAKEVTVTLR